VPEVFEQQMDVFIHINLIPCFVTVEPKVLSTKEHMDERRKFVKQQVTQSTITGPSTIHLDKVQGRLDANAPFRPSSAPKKQKQKTMPRALH
jgi:hypothetical protein